eukprot:RCo042722
MLCDSETLRANHPNRAHAGGADEHQGAGGAGGAERRALQRGHQHADLHGDGSDGRGDHRNDHSNCEAAVRPHPRWLGCGPEEDPPAAAGLPVPRAACGEPVPRGALPAGIPGRRRPPSQGGHQGLLRKDHGALRAALKFYDAPRGVLDPGKAGVRPPDRGAGMPLPAARNAVPAPAGAELHLRHSLRPARRGVPRELRRHCFAILPGEYCREHQAADDGHDAARPMHCGPSGGAVHGLSDGASGGGTFGYPAGAHGCRARPARSGGATVFLWRPRRPRGPGVRCSAPAVPCHRGDRRSVHFPRRALPGGRPCRLLWELHHPDVRRGGAAQQ